MSRCFFTVMWRDRGKEMAAQITVGPYPGLSDEHRVVEFPSREVAAETLRELLNAVERSAGGGVSE